MLEFGTLFTLVKQRTEYALNCGALRSIPTECEFVEQDGICFMVRSLSNLVRKEEARKVQEQKSAAGQAFNPFLPYEEDLFVADLSATHLCLLNKFNVVDYHLLIITRAFEDQEHWLTQRDFEALGCCLQEIDGLAFYNGGKLAGASQPHKHLQLIPLPMGVDGERLPVEAAIAAALSDTTADGIAIASQFPFAHGIAHLDTNQMADRAIAAEYLCDRYQALLQAVGLLERGQNLTEQPQAGPYNLLVTRQWMLLVPRSQESFESISINSLGFAGSLFVRNADQMALLKRYGPMTLLKQVSYPR